MAYLNYFYIIILDDYLSILHYIDAIKIYLNLTQREVKHMLPGHLLVNNIRHFLFNFNIAYHFVNFALIGQVFLYGSNRSVQLNL